MNRDTSFCFSNQCPEWRTCERALTSERVEAIQDGNGYSCYSVSTMLVDGKCVLKP